MTHGTTIPYIVEIKKMENEGCRKLFDLPEGVINDLECHRRVYSTDACTPTLNARHDSTKILEMKKMDDFSKYMNEPVLIKQATKDGIIPCDIGGGGRPKLCIKHNEKGKGPGARADMSCDSNGEYP